MKFTKIRNKGTDTLHKHVDYEDKVCIQYKHGMLTFVDYNLQCKQVSVKLNDLLDVINDIKQRGIE